MYAIKHPSNHAYLSLVPIGSDSPFVSNPNHITYFADLDYAYEVAESYTKRFSLTEPLQVVPSPELSDPSIETVAITNAASVLIASGYHEEEAIEVAERVWLKVKNGK